MKTLNKILRQNNNIWQIVGAIIGSFMGLLLLLLSIQFYIDLNDLTESEAYKQADIIHLHLEQKQNSLRKKYKKFKINRS